MTVETIMQCQQAHELYSDFVAGTLERPLTVSMENHLASCASCREEVAGVRSVWQSLDHMEVVEPPRFFHENLMARIDMEAEKATEAQARKQQAWDWRVLFRPRAVLTYASVALVLMLTGVGLHTTKAELDPLGVIMSWLFPAPRPVLAVQTPRAEVQTDANGNATMVVHLSAPPKADSIGSPTYHVAVTENGAKLGESNVNALSPRRETIVRIPLTQSPANPTVTLTISDAQDAGKSSTIPVPVTATPTPTP